MAEAGIVELLNTPKRMPLRLCVHGVRQGLPLNLVQRWLVHEKRPLGKERS